MDSEEMSASAIDLSKTSSLDEAKLIVNTMPMKSKDTVAATLKLAPFQPITYLSYGNVRIGTLKICTLRLQNPNILSDELEVLNLNQIEEKGFMLNKTPSYIYADQENQSLVIFVPANSNRLIEMNWGPKQPGNVRISIRFRSRATGQLFQVYLVGFGVHANNGSSKQKETSKLSDDQSNVVKRKAMEPLSSQPSSKVSHSENIKNVAKQNSRSQDLIPKFKIRSSLKPVKLKLVRSSALPKKESVNFRPSPFITRPELYEEDWAERQIKSFTRWLNFEFNGGDWTFVGKTKGNSFNRFSEHLKRQQICQMACRLYQSESFNVVLQKLITEVERSRIVIKNELSITEDIGARDDIINVLLNYSPIWLALGIEVISGKIITSYDIHTLTFAITKHIISEDSIKLSMLSAVNVPLNKEELKLKLNQVVLKKFLVLVLLLDRGKLTRLVPGDPCLFNKDATVKSSRDVIIQFSKYLSGEGDIIRHLMFMGYSVSHTQKPLDEYNFLVTNLAVDLRDGVRLARLVELHTKDFTILQTLKYPVQSPAQKLKNMEVIFRQLEKEGIFTENVSGGMISPKDIVDGNREKTLALLWKLTFHWKVSVMLDKEYLKDEITYIQRKHKLALAEDNFYFQSEQLSLLYQWSKSVCSVYKLSIHNFTSSFGDGRALCLLIAHYHPDIISLSSISHPRHKSTDTDFSSLVAVQNNCMVFSPGRNRSEPLVTKNFQLFNNALRNIGGIPILLTASDSLLQDEKSVIVTVTYLCARLMTLRREIRAAKIIQKAYRRCRLRKLLANRLETARIIHRACEKFILRKRAKKVISDFHAKVVVIQRVWRAYQMRKEKVFVSCLVRIQAHARGALKRRNLKVNQRAAFIIQKAYFEYRQRQADLFKHRLIIVQSTVKGYLERKRFLSLKSAALVIQRCYRGHLARADVFVLRWTTHLQALARGYITRSNFQQVRAHATKIQSVFRMRHERVEYVQSKTSCIKIQRWFRYLKMVHTAQTYYLLVKESTLVIQTYARRWLAQMQYRRESAARTIQSTYRMFVQYNRFKMTRVAAVSVQRAYRRLMLSRFTRIEYLRTRLAVIIVQRAWRHKKQMTLQHQMMQLHHAAALTIQNNWRMSKCRHNYNQLKLWSSVIQARYRGKLTRSHFLAQKRAVTIIASAYKARRDRVQYLKTYQSVVKAQAVVRGYLARQDLMKLRELRTQYLIRCAFVLKCTLAAKQIQTTYRKFVALKNARRTLDAIITIQQWWCACRVRLKYQKTYDSILFVQRTVRKRHQKKLAAIKIIQSHAQTMILRSRFVRQKRSILRIQSIWRGYLVRKISTKMIAEHRRRIREINAAAEEHMKLGNRAEMGLNLLLTSSHMSVVLKACFHLDAATSLSRECCARLINHDAIRIIFKLIKSCNRSKPHMEVLKHVVHILQHMSMYPETAPSVLRYADDAVDVLLELLQNYREFEDFIIYKRVARILLLQSQYPYGFSILSKQKDVYKRLTNVQALMDRKLAIDAKSKKIPERKSKLYEPTQVLKPVIETLREE